VYYLFDLLNRTILSPGDVYAAKPGNLLVATVLFLGYVWFLLKMEKREFGRLPVVGKYIAKL
jgi:hypothetical protein